MKSIMELMVWGANSHGQLGCGKFSEYELPTIITDVPKDIMMIKGGGGHTIILDSEGYLYVSGWNNKGQLGIGSTVDVSQFLRVNFAEKFAVVSCGWDTSAGITVDGRLFVWGSNSQNQLGFSCKRHKTILRPIELILPLNESVNDIQFGLRYCVVLTKSNQIFVIGLLKQFKNTNHRLINHNSCEYLHIVPTSKIHQLACGQHHISFVDDDRNSTHGIGDNKFMQCSKLSPGGKIILVSAGWTHNAVLIESGELYLYGRNNYGQCGNGSRSEHETPQKFNLHPVDDFQLGAEHGILKSNEEIYTWGWNEHGNCGNGNFEDVLKPERIKLPKNRKAISITAGSGFCILSLTQIET